MSKGQTLEVLKRRIAKLPVNRAGYRRHYPAALKQSVVAFMEQRKKEGEMQQSVAEKLNLNDAMLSDWKRKYGSKKNRRTHVRRVHVVEEPSGEPSHEMVVVLPSGIRVEGLDVHGLVELIQELS